MDIFTDELEAKLRKLKVYTKAKKIAIEYNTDWDDTEEPPQDNIDGLFVFSDTPQGHDYWYVIYDKIDGMVIPKKNVIGGNLI